MDNSLLAVRDINHKYIVVEKGDEDGMQPVVILLVSGVIMFSVIGGLSLLAHYYTLNGIKSKTVGDGQHGTCLLYTSPSPRD